MQDQDARSGRVVQARPSRLDLLQLAEGLTAEVLNGALVAGLVRVQAELAVDLPPSDPLWGADREGAVDQPQVEVQAQGGAFEGGESVHVNRYGVVDDLIEEVFAEADFALPQRLLVGLALVPPILASCSNRRSNEPLHVHIVVGQLHGAIEQPPHLIAELGSCPPAAAIDSEFPHELCQR